MTPQEANQVELTVSNAVRPLFIIALEHMHADKKHPGAFEHCIGCAVGKVAFDGALISAIQEHTERKFMKLVVDGEQIPGDVKDVNRSAWWQQDRRSQQRYVGFYACHCWNYRIIMADDSVYEYRHAFERANVDTMYLTTVERDRVDLTYDAARYQREGYTVQI